MIRVLIVDDDQDILTIAKTFLEVDPDFIVHTASSPYAALSRLHENSYEIIISDQMMDDMDGITFLRKVKATHPHLPFIFYTAQEQESVIINALNLGADFYLKKSLDIKTQIFELKQIIRLIVERSAANSRLLASEFKFKTIADSSYEWVFWIDPAGVCLYMSPSSEAVTGYTPDDFVADPDLLKEIVYNEDRHLWFLAHEAPCDQVAPHDLRITCRDGSLRWISHAYEPVHNSTGEYLGVRVSNRDISERKAAEIGLVRERDNFLSIFNAAPIGLLLLNTQIEITLANDVVREVVLRDPAEIIQKRGGEGLGCVHSAEDPRGCGFSSSCPECPLRAGIEAVLHDGESVHGKSIPLTLMLSGKPSLRWLRISAEPVVIDDRRFVIVAIDDITTQRKIEEALSHSEERFRSLFANMLEGFAYCQMIYDDAGAPVDWIYLEVNDAFERLTGLVGVKGRRVTEVIPTIREETPELFYLYEQVASTGEPREIEINFTPLSIWLDISVYSPEKGFFVAVFTNNTARKTAEERLKAIAAEHQAIVSNVPSMIWLKDTKGRYVNVNTAAARVMGRLAEDIEGKTFTEICPDQEDRYSSRDQTVIQTGTSLLGVSDELCMPDGRRIWVQTDSVPVTDDQGRITGILIVSTDVSEAKMARDAVTLANHKLNLLSGITRHDIGNELQVMLGYLGFAWEDEENPTLKTYIEKAESAAHHIERQIAFTRDYQDLGVQAPRWQDVGFVIARAAASSARDQVPIINEVSEIEIYADPLIEKVFFNHIDNAKRYGVTLTLIRFSGSVNDTGYHLICEDDGVGVSREYKEKIFNREYFQHTGYGLHLSREILDITGIRIRECGEEGKGARFEILVPEGHFRLIGQNRQVV